jgi:tetratricopeptide (TPR) repeat protein
MPVRFNDMFFAGDVIRVMENARARFTMCNEANLSLDQNTTITFAGLEKEKTFLMELMRGIVHVFSRDPRGLKVVTPHVNGVVEGTELLVKVEQDQTLLTIFEGQVLAANELGDLSLSSGQSAVAKAGQAPTSYTLVHPRDAVQWALYYPPVIDFRPEDFPGEAQAMLRTSIDQYWDGDLAGAFASLEQVPEVVHDPRFFTYRAGLLLTVGRVDEARVDIDRALSLDPSNSHAFALQSVIDVVQNKKDSALDLANKAVDLDPESAAAKVALSYAQQAQFDLEGALNSVKEAVDLDPENALAWARLAELCLSFGYLNKALDAANKAVSLNPNVAHTETVLGFAYLDQIKTQESREAFEKAIELDQAAPLPRLGLGLAKIREGHLHEGRAEIEIAASLNPNNSLIRSYLGKAYFEEKRVKLDEPQYAIAKELDPLDPTPWFYDAIRKQTVNRPVEALHDLQKSIELNDNRAVYRSRLLLDEDLAARGATLARIYNELGFQQLALVEGWKSLNTDPSDYSAHRFLSDLYSVLPRHETARVSELLQSQLLQPINIAPVQPLLAESNLFILQGAGPASPSLNEFNPLFNRNRIALLASGVAGEKDTLGDELVLSGILDGLSYSVGQFHWESDGFRENNDQDQNIYNIFLQGSPSYKTSVQAEIRYREADTGDLLLRFDPTDFFNLRRDDEMTSVRLGFHYAFTPHSDLIGSAIYRRAELNQNLTGGELQENEHGVLTEIQHLFGSEKVNIISGLGNFYADHEEMESTIFTDFSRITRQSDIWHTNLYVYTHINYPRCVTWTLGASADFFKIDLLDLERNQLNPKFGVTWNLLPGTTLRAAVFRALKRMLISNQTIEPTQVAGFNQFFDDISGADTWRYGIALDQKFSQNFWGGAEFSKRELNDVPWIELGTGQLGGEVDFDEEFARAYLNWAPHPWWALSGEYQYERFKRDPEFTSVELFTNVTTHRWPVAVSFFHPSGISARLMATYVDQEGEFLDPLTGAFFSADDQFWVVDAAVQYRLPKRWGLITLEVKNLLDEQFSFQDTDPANPTIYPDRLIIGKVTLSF